MGKQQVGFLTATVLVVANMIGSGVFTSLGFQAAELPSTTILLFLWVCGGLIALCGGLSYAQLARLYPGSGGEYNYVRQFYPPIIAYMAGFVSVVAGFAAPVALSAMACSAYTASIVGNVPVKLVAWLIVTVITLLHCISIAWSGRFQQVSTLLKLTLVLIFIICGFRTSGQANAFLFRQEDLSLISSRGFAVALVYVSFAYSGWNASVYIFNEISRPDINIRRSIITGTITVTLIYVLLNTVFLKTVALNNLRGVIEVGAVSARYIFGAGGGRMMSAMIGLLLISSLSAMIWIGPRVGQRVAADLSIRLISKVTSKGIPLWAIGLQYVITSLLLLTGTFAQIMSSTGVILNISSFMAVTILFSRIRLSDWKQWLAPAIYLIMTIYSIVVVLIG